MRLRDRWAAGAVLLWAAGGAVCVHAQSGSSQVSGRILDSFLTSIPEATVTLVNTRTGIERRAASSEDGFYSIPFLGPGEYRLSIQKEDFQPAVRTGIKLDMDENLVLDVVLCVASVKQAVEVTGDESAVVAQLRDGANTLGGTVTSDRIDNLPLKGRNSSAFMMLVPGVRATRVTTSQPPLESHYQFFSVNGSRPGQNQFILDGGNNTNVGFNAPEYSAQVESVLEFKVQTSNFNAEYANAAGAVISIVTKSGTNELHGSLFEYFRNDALAANDFFSNQAGKSKPMFRFNQFGGTAGGPLKRNRTFFFFGYEGLRLRDPIITTTTVPTALQKAGDFSKTTTGSGALITIHDPYTTRAARSEAGVYQRSPFPGNVIPKLRINPVAAELQGYYPAPTSPGDPMSGLNNYFFSGLRTRPFDDVNGRMDHQLRQSTLLMTRYSRSSTTITNPAVFGTSNMGSPGYSRYPQSHTAAIFKATEAHGPTMFSEFLASFNRFVFDRRGLSNGFDPRKLGFPDYLAEASPNLGFPLISPEGVSSLGGYSNEHDAYDRMEIKANVSKLTGRHTLKFGGLFSGVHFNSAQNTTQAGSYSFTKSFTQGPDPFQSIQTSGSGYATFLLGALGAGTHNPQELHSALSQQNYGLYVQDDYRMSSKLNLSIGLRYDRETPRVERHDELANFDYSSKTELPDGTTLRGGLLFPGTRGLPRGHWNPQNLNFAPRIGFAYSITANTVLRGGYGLFYSNTWGSGRNGNGVPSTGFTCSSTATASLDGGLTPHALLNDPFPKGFCRASGSAAGLLTSLGQSVDMIDRNQQLPYAQSWNFVVLRRLPKETGLEMAYSGSRGIHLAGTLEWNQLETRYLALGTQLNAPVRNPFRGWIKEGPLSAESITLGQSLRPYPQFLGVSSRNASYGGSVYHAMYVKVERRLRGGLGIQGAYTWAKLIDDVIPSRTGFPGESFSGAPLQNYLDRRNERSLAAFDTPQSLVASFVYELPFGPGGRFLSAAGRAGKALQGWQINGIVMFQSGPPLQISGGNYSGAFAGTQRPNWSGADATLRGPSQGRLGEYFDTSAFSFNEPFTFGNAPRIMPNLRGPGTATFDLSVFKSVGIREKMRLQFRAEAFNAFNRVQFNVPNTSINSSAFGRISSQANSPRDIQLVLKLLF